MSARLSDKHLYHVLEETRELWTQLRGNRIFITGGTGFFGCWLLESLVWANNRLGLKASASVLTRAPASFGRKAPHLANDPSIVLHSGDVSSFTYPEGAFEFIIHAAADTNAQATADSLDATSKGTSPALEFAHRCGAANFLPISSCAVYRDQPATVPNLPEDLLGAPEPSDVSSVYGEGKRVAELLCALCSSKFGLECKIARCFAFVGPYLPRESHFPIPLLSKMHFRTVRAEP